MAPGAMSGARYRKITATEGLSIWLTGMAEAADEMIGSLPTWAVLEAKNSPDPSGKAFYSMGWADAMRHCRESVEKGLRAWIHPDTGEIIGVDVMGEPNPFAETGHDPA